MRPVLLRRLLVFGVCLAGACSLHLAPTLAGPAGAHRGPTEQLLRPITAPAEAATGDEVAAAPRGGSAAQMELVASVEAALATDRVPVSDHLTLDPLPLPPQSTPFAPGTPTDQVAPGPVAPVVVAVTGDTVELSWPAATDDVGVVAYRVEVNGFERAVTDQLRVGVTWAPSDGDVNTVRVTAEDAAGNRSGSTAPILVTRPAPVATPTVPPTVPPSVPASPLPAPTTPTTPAPRAPGPAPSESPVEVSPVPRVIST